MQRCRCSEIAGNAACLWFAEARVDRRLDKSECYVITFFAIGDRWVSDAQNPCEKTPVQLTANQQLVLEALQQAKAPLGAYALLHQLRESGIAAPMQVYRSLDRLIEQGLVHRLETLNAYVNCSKPGGCADGFTAFAICDNCGRTTEFVDSALGRDLKRWAKDNAFFLGGTTIEIHGRCAQCAGLAQPG